MNRREVLASLGSAGSLALAGCSSLVPSGNASPDPSGNASGSTDERVVSLAAVDDVPSEHNVAMTAEVLDSRITAEHTARVRVTTTNTGRKRAISVAPGMCALFNRARGGSDDPEGLWLHRPEQAKHIERRGDRWVRDRPASEPRVYAAYGCLAETYAHGETATNEYEVWDDYRVDGYMEPGTYRWEERVELAEPLEKSDYDTLGSFTWGFSLELERP